MVELRTKTREPSAEASHDDVAGLLLACHDRIRRFLAVAHRLAVQPASPSEIAEAATSVQRYFSVALPLHAEDEDLSVLPRLQASGPVAAAHLAETLAAQHEDIHVLIARMVALWRELVRNPERRDQSSGPLATGARRLEALFEGHLELEERVIFPAVRALPLPDRVAIVAEMRARRSRPGEPR